MGNASNLSKHTWDFSEDVGEERSGGLLDVTLELEVRSVGACGPLLTGGVEDLLDGGSVEDLSESGLKRVSGVTVVVTNVINVHVASSFDQKFEESIAYDVGFGKSVSLDENLVSSIDEIRGVFGGATDESVFLQEGSVGSSLDLWINPSISNCSLRTI